MKVMRTQLHRTIYQSGEARGLHMNYAILILQNVLGQEELASHYGQPLPLVEIGRHNDLRYSGFVFHRDEDDSWTSRRHSVMHSISMSSG